MPRQTRQDYQPAFDKTRAVAYIRVSTDKQELSPDAQRDVIQRWAKFNDIKIVSFHEDVCTGSMPWVERPGLTEAVNIVKRHEASWLVVAVLDRLSRDLYNMLHLQRELEQYDARVISCTENPNDADSPERQLMSNVVGSFAQYEKAKIRARVKAALAVRRAQGVRLGARPLDSTELGRCIIWAAWMLKDKGYGVKKIAQLMNDQGIVGPKGGAMHYRNLQKLFQKPRPEEKPKAWNGFTQTWKKFSVTRRTNRSIVGNSSNLGAPRRREARASGADRGAVVEGGML